MSDAPVDDPADAAPVQSFVIIVKNPIIDREIMRIETVDRGVALMEAQTLSSRHGVCVVYDTTVEVEIARFRYGREESYRS